MTADLPSDSELVRGARSGDAGSLGVLLQRHRATMRAVALGVLGHRPEVDDVVQESCLRVLHRLGDLREPEAFKSWVRSIVRNQALRQLRARTATPVADLATIVPASRDLDPARLTEGHALADWLWHAVGRLPPEQQVVTMLRHFSTVTAYEQIAEVCGTPVGTVRSRLHQARLRLTHHLLAEAEAGHADHQALTRTKHREAAEMLAAGRAGRYGEALAQTCLPTLEVIWGKGKRTRGLNYPTLAMHRDVGDGVTFQLTDVIAGPDVVIWETDLISPPEDPSHCPPTAVWVHTLSRGRSQKIRIFHPPRT
jgi:RNA polymerase sigma factor (sigma-70 family)